MFRLVTVLLSISQLLYNTIDCAYIPYRLHKLASHRLIRHLPLTVATDKVSSHGRIGEWQLPSVITDALRRRRSA